MIIIIMIQNTAMFLVLYQKSYSAKVFYRQNADIREANVFSLMK